jgi:serine/threonine-protein kinase haspin
MRISVLGENSTEAKPLPQPKSTSKALPPDWRSFHPRTNLIWLHFILRKLLSSAVGEEQDTRQPLQNRDQGVDSPNTQPRSFSSPSKCLDDATARALELETALRCVDELLDPAELGSEQGLESTRDLIAVAVMEGWLSEPDVLELGS